jgi:3-hydroxy-9,10-secoandrosta-1,3,5(10)-triene-9,17-dione monooxygenase reductase component
MAIDPRELRNVMGHFATGVTVITTKDKTDKPFGLTANAFSSLSLDPPLTANAFSSLSLDPPLLLVCVDKTVDCYACFEDSKVFAVNVLSLEQEELSTRFATKGIEKFEGVSYSLGGLGVPLLDGALAHIECRVAAGYEGGDHTIYTGEVQTIATADADPLLFYKGKYSRLAE